MSFWQKLHKVQNSSTFWFGAPSAGANNRNAQAHVPWGNNAIYFDTAGCCNGGTQRIQKGWSNAEFMKWHHYTFVKDGPDKRIYMDGNLWHSGRNTLALKSDWNRATIGAEHNGGNKTDREKIAKSIVYHKANGLEIQKDLEIPVNLPPGLIGKAADAIGVSLEDRDITTLETVI